MVTPDYDELRARMEKVLAKETFDERHAICWHGYLAALTEWNLITIDEHTRLSDMIPVDDPDAVTDTFLS